MSDFKKYLVTLTSTTFETGSVAEMEVPSTQGPEAAGRRAYFTAVHLGWGDLDEVSVVSIEDITEETPAAGNHCTVCGNTDHGPDDCTLHGLWSSNRS